jgi:hypothetical protein
MEAAGKKVEGAQEALEAERRRLQEKLGRRDCQARALQVATATGPSGQGFTLSAHCGGD